MKQIKKTIIALFTIVIATGCCAIAAAETGNTPGTLSNSNADESNPVALDIKMAPIVQATVILPFAATATNSNISSFTVETVPAANEGVLSIDMNGVPMPVSQGMMLSPDLASSITFTPAASFSGDVVFTYSATDENSLISNVAQYTIPVVGEQIVLPITLLNFSGSMANRKAQLQWQTKQENNSSYFELQRSTDGKSFETIATITAKGNARNDYQQADDLFFYNFTTVYYRIKMVSNNGDFKYSGQVMLQAGAEVKASIKVWPLPFSSNLNIAYSSDRDESVKITISSVNGATILSSGSLVKKGNNNINFNQAQSIPAGTYLLTISNGTTAQTIKVIKH